ncbi:conjugal transfer protein TraF [Shewanella benthica]|uniref:conjugal transfer protein TraF n=1 Tax=Shewanella benthica TaxID=43661 RepID=UPI0009FD7666
MESWAGSWDRGFATRVAHEFNIAGSKVSLGITPKYQIVDTFYYVTTTQGFDADDFDADNYRVSDSNFNLDFGASVKLNEQWILGLMARGLLSHEYQTLNPVLVYRVEPMVTVGIGYRSDWLTAGLDVDLTSKDRFGQELGATQFVRAGVELNGWDWAQVRFGYRYDTKDNAKDFITAGLGFSPFDVVHLEMTASYADENELGAGLELAFTF